MNQPVDNEHLLADVLAEAAPAGFREALLGETLRLARRRRLVWQARRTITVLAVAGVLAILVWRNLPPRPAVGPAPVTGCQIIHTRPLPVGNIVTTLPLPAGQLVVSVPTAEIILTSADSGGFRRIGDDELLALAAPRPAVLVRLGPNSEELIFVDAAEQTAFP